MIYLDRGYRDKKYDECEDETAFTRKRGLAVVSAETTPLLEGYKGKNGKTSCFFPHGRRSVVPYVHRKGTENFRVQEK